MLHWAIVLLIVGLFAALFGFGGIASTAFAAAKTLVFFKVLGIVLLLAGAVLIVWAG